MSPEKDFVKLNKEAIGESTREQRPGSSATPNHKALSPSLGSAPPGSARGFRVSIKQKINSIRMREKEDQLRRL